MLLLIVQVCVRFHLLEALEVLSLRNPSRLGAGRLETW